MKRHRLVHVIDVDDEAAEKVVPEEAGERHAVELLEAAELEDARVLIAKLDVADAKGDPIDVRTAGGLLPSSDRLQRSVRLKMKLGEPRLIDVGDVGAGVD